MKQITLLSFLFLSFFSLPAQELLITEIMYNPDNSDSSWEWVEVYNSGQEPLDLSGYVIDDNSGAAYIESNIASGIIPSGESAILFNASAISASEFLEVWGTVDLIAVSRWSALNNGGDSIGIWNSFASYDGDNASQANVIEQVIYEADGDWPEDDGAASIYLTDLTADNSNGANWALSVLGDATPLFETYSSTVFESNDGQDIASPGLSGAVDTENPTVICPENIVMASDDDNCGSTFPFLIPTGTDNVTEDLTFLGVRDDGLELTDIYPVGLTLISWTAVDEAGNVSMPCTQEILITDDVSPTITCNNTIQAVSLDANPIAIEIELATASNVCEGELTIEWIRSDEKELEEPFPVGDTMITWFATDSSGNTAECVQLVTVAFTGSDANDITSFSVPNQIGDARINTADKTVLLRVPFGTDVTALVPTFAVSENATITPETGVAQDFSNPVNYTVIAENGSEAVWTVLVDLEEEQTVPLEITSFVLVNADTNEDLLILQDGMQIDQNELPTLHLNIRVEASENVESVRISLEGPQHTSRTENIAPFALFGDAPVGNYNGNEFVEGSYTLQASPYSEDNLAGESGETLQLNFEFIQQVEVSVTEFIVVNADTNEDLFSLEEGMQIEISTLPTRNLNIRANTSEGVQSVRMQLAGEMSTARTENIAPYALFGDSPAGNYNGAEFPIGLYNLSAIPYSEDSLSGEMGESLAINFELIDTLEVLSVTSLILVNADTNEDIFDLIEGMQIDIGALPTSNLNIRANMTTDVESVSLMLSGAQTVNRTENVAPYSLFGDFPVGNYNGSSFEFGSYRITATGYSENNLNGEMGEPLSINFQLIDSQASAERANQMLVYPNPASSEAIIEFANSKEVTIIYLYDILGRVVGSYLGNEVARDNHYVLELNTIPEGNYYVRSLDSDGTSYLKQIVIKK